MKTKNPIALIAGWLALAFSPGNAAEQAGGNPAAQPPVTPTASRSAQRSDEGLPTGSVSGRVSNHATNAYLEGARVELQPSGLVTLTALDGSYAFSRVPAGSHTLLVSYTGLEPRSVTVSVEAGRTETLDVALTSGVYLLDAVTVSGEREGNALAVTRQRNSANVKNVLSADAFGNVADENIGSFLLKVPGVAGDQAEGQIVAIKVRGVAAELNSVTVNGTRMGDASTRGGQGDRAFQLDTLPADFVDTIEVTKSPTPDMDADSVGGNVNLKTKSSLSQKGRLMTYKLGGTYTVARKKRDPQMSFMFSDQFGKERNLGVLVTASFSGRTGPRDVNLVNWEAKPDPGVAYFFLLNGGEDYLTMKRSGLGVRFDYRLSNRSTVYLNLLGAGTHDRLWRHHNNFSGVSATTVLPGYTTFITETRNLTWQANHQNRTRDTRTYSSEFGGETRISDFKVDYNLNKSWANGWEQTLSAAPTVAGVGFRFDRSHLNNAYGATTFTQISGPSIVDPANLRFGAAGFTDVRRRDSILGGQLNVYKPIELAAPAYLKMGLRFRSQHPLFTSAPTSWAYSGPGGTALARFYDQGYLYQPAALRGTEPSVRFFSIPAILAEMKAHPEYFTLNKVAALQNRLSNDRQASESVYAGYVMSGVQFGKLNVLGGVRMEETDVKGTGSFRFISAAEKARRAAWVGTVTEEENLRRTQAEYGNRVSNQAKYRNVFPGIHFRYELARGLQARASYSKGIGRPNFTTIIPNNSVNDVSMSVTANNTSLRPQRADNFDVSLEYYYEPAGLISVGLFRKEIKDFIYSAGGELIPAGDDNGFGGQFVGYTLSTQYNGGSAKIRGLEVNYQQQFSNLPGFWRGFSVYANGTWLETSGNYGDAPGVTRSGGLVPGFVPFTANVGVSYIKHPWTIRVKENFAGRSMVGSINATPSLQQFNYGRKFMDVNLAYSITPRYNIYVDVVNVFADSLSGGAYIYIPGRPRGPDRFNTEIKAGVTGRF